MELKPDPTRAALVERAAAGEVRRQSRLFSERMLLRILPEVVPCALVVLNAQRQIVFANDRFMDLAYPGKRRDQVYGLRPGEALGCIHANESLDGCGTTEFCSTCGAVGAILASQQGQAEVRECRILRGETSEALDLRVWASPVEVEGESFSVFAALDISHEKRRQALERIFLHDIHNVACGLSWCIGFLDKAGPQERGRHLDDIRRLCRELNEEIGAQRTLLRAESGELVFTQTKFGTLDLLNEAIDLYRSHPVAQGRALCLDERAQDATVVSDRVLLLRVVCNLIKNALEACREGQTVTVGCTAADGMAEFWVHNAGFMPREVQLQIFQRSFSTKGLGRGLGTYSVRLLTERYLKGSVSFTSSAEFGTTFRVRCPATAVF